MRCIVHAADGAILRIVVCSRAQAELQAQAGETVIEDTWGGTSDARHRIVDGERVEFTPEPPAPPSIEAQRAMAYPPMTDQLDALWHAMDAGVLPMVPAFYDPVKAVKAALPKVDES